MAKSVKSVEPNIAELANEWLRSYELDYKIEQAPLNTEIDIQIYYSITTAENTSGRMGFPFYYL